MQANYCLHLIFMIYLKAKSPQGVRHARSLIVDGNADVNTDGKDEPPLFIAIRKDNSDILQLIVSNGANVNAIYDDMTPLMYCYKISKGEYSRNADLLLKNLSDNFDWGHKDAEGNTVMHSCGIHPRSCALTP